MKTFKILSAVFLIAIVGKTHAQDLATDSHTIGITIPTVAIVDIEPAGSKSILMPFTAPIEAGLPIVAPANNTSLWLNYSYIPSVALKTAKVSVKIGAVIPGLSVNVQAAAASGLGGGTRGAVAGNAITLTAADQDIVTAIGASYTGDVANGHNLTYSLVAGSYAGLFASVPVATITYTIAEN